MTVKLIGVISGKKMKAKVSSDRVQKHIYFHRNFLCSVPASMRIESRTFCLYLHTMKRLYLIIILATFSLLAFSKEYKVHGSQGGLAMEVTLPDRFNEETDKCPMVILMHGIFSSKNIVPIPALAKALAKEGIASICFDFGGHWKSEGKMEHMTISKEIEDALAMWEYAKSLPYVSKIGLLGHSQGGVVASMTAGILASRGESPAALAYEHHPN